MGLPEIREKDCVLDSACHLIERGEFLDRVNVVLADGEVGSGKAHCGHLGSIGPPSN